MERELLGSLEAVSASGEPSNAAPTVSMLRGGRPAYPAGATATGQGAPCIISTPAVPGTHTVERSPAGYADDDHRRPSLRGQPVLGLGHRPLGKFHDLDLGLAEQSPRLGVESVGVEGRCP